MVTIRGYTLITKITDENVTEPNTARVEFDIDSVSDLPTDGKLKGYTLYQGSIAYDIGAGKFYVMDSEGTWHDSEDGSEVSPT